METKSTGVCVASRETFNFDVGSSNEGKNLVAEKIKNTVKDLSITRKEYLNKTLFLEQWLLLDIEKSIEIFTKRISLIKMMRGESSDKSIRSKSVVKKIVSLANPKKEVVKK